MVTFVRQTPSSVSAWPAPNAYPAERATAKELGAIITGLRQPVRNQTNEHSCSLVDMRQDKNDFTNQKPEAVTLCVLLSGGSKVLVSAVCESSMDTAGLDTS